MCSLSFDSIDANVSSTRPSTSADHYADRWDKADISCPKGVLVCEQQSCNILDAINNYNEAIVHALQMASAASVPKIKHSALKAFWNEDLDDLKQQSIDWHKLWSECSKPRCGVVK